MAIPRIFHQIWVGSDPFPEEYEALQEFVARAQPGLGSSASGATTTSRRA